MGVHQAVALVSGEESGRSVSRRRFLVTVGGEHATTEGAAVSNHILEQYYLVVDQDQELRVRRADERTVTMTLKERAHGEVTIGVDPSTYEELAQYRLGRVLRKIRCTFLAGPHKGWSLDVFDEDSPFAGIAIAEFEMADKHTSLPELPSEWEIVADISGLADFENRNLALHGPPDLAIVAKWSPTADSAAGRVERWR
jgi:CYTH domain-containing protein